MSTALQIVTEAYRKHNLDEVTSFSTSQEFPFNIALNTINDVIRYANRLGSYWFTETKTSLTYGVSTYTYSFNTLGVDPKRIKFIRKEATDKWGELKEVNHREFLKLYRRQALVTTEPTAWTKFGDTLELNTQPDQDYSIKVYHFKDMPVVSATTDTFLVPERDEDILIESCYLMLGAKIGKWKRAEAEAEIRFLFGPFLADLKQDSGMPTQFPAAF